MSEENWRTEVTATDYFLHAKKEAQIASRRPAIRTASDLVGPGIGSTAVQITDFNDLLATFNGYFSSEPGALAAPNATEGFIGYVVSDAVMGGEQVFTGLTSGVRYSRRFNRSPTDAEALGWTNWQGFRIPATVDGSGTNFTLVATSRAEPLTGPRGTSIGDPDVFEISDAGLRVRKQGVYTGHIEVGSTTAGITGSVVLLRPAGSTDASVTYAGVDLSKTVFIPLTVWATNETTGFTVAVRQTVALAECWWRYQFTRIGDAV